MRPHPIFAVSDERHVRTCRLYAISTRFEFGDDFTSWHWLPDACWTPLVGSVRGKPIGYLVAKYLGAREL